MTLSLSYVFEVSLAPDFTDSREEGLERFALFLLLFFYSSNGEAYGDLLACFLFASL
jgi:hypothetical protein